MKYILSLFIAMIFLILNTSAQNHQEIESPTADVLSLNSTGSPSTVLNFLNADAAPTGGSDKRAYISTNGNVLNFGLSNNNDGGKMQWIGDGQTRMTMNADGRLGLNTTPAVNTLFSLASSNLATSGHFKNTSTGSFGTALFAESTNGIGILAEGKNYGGWFEVTNSNGTALFADGYSHLDGKVRIGEDPSTPDLEGQMRYNSTTKDFEGYNGSEWVSLTKGINRTNKLVDIGGNEYETVIIGQQVWMAENLAVGLLNDNTPIENYSTSVLWNTTTNPSYSYYDNLIDNEQLYGYIYNGIAVNSGKLCPTGWHIPTKTDFEELRANLGETSGSKTFASKLKSLRGDWDVPNYASDEVGFRIHPGGQRSQFGQYYGIGEETEIVYIDNSGFSRVYVFEHDEYLFGGGTSLDDNEGAYVRCIKN